MNPAGAPERAGGVAALALVAVVLLLSVLDATPLVALPLAVLVLATPATPRWRWLLLGAAVWALGVGLSGGELASLSLGWALLLGSAFLAATLWRREWGVLPRALLAVGVALVVAVVALAATGHWAEMDSMFREHFRSVSTLALGDLDARFPGEPWVAQLRQATERATHGQWLLFPAMLALQSLAALGLACWMISRLRGGPVERYRLRPLREFRFNDQLVWLLVVGLVLVALPLGETGTRLGYNALLFMAALYALRGLAVFVFLAGRAPSFLSIAFGVLVGIFLYPLVLTAALMVGLGDTWLDVRARAVAAPPT